MSAEQFQALCDEFCDLAGTSRPVLVPDERGLLAFHTTIRGYCMTCIHVPPADADDVYLLVDIGEMPAQAGLEAWKTLMRTNTFLFGSHTPVIGLSRRDHLLIQQVVPLRSATARALMASVTGVADWADQWHAGKWLGQEPAATADMPAGMGQLA